jgi:hypothetical protein
MCGRPPAVWSFMCLDWLGLAWSQSVGWWGALSRAQSPRAVMLRSALLYQDALGETSAALDHLVRHTLNPHGLVATLEDLICEGRLSRAQATLLEEAILRQTASTGAWKADARGISKSTAS